MPKTPFPDDFTWGVSTSAYQIEGAVAEDGRAPSIWDTFSHTPGKILNDETGDVATDHYHRYREDVALMAELGVTGYRFSIAWPRVIPDGSGDVNLAGLDFYQRLVDELLENGIEPWPTLYHWDLPQALQDRGGWEQRETVDAFVRYADVTSSALGDRVSHWITHNEPWVASFLGYLEGFHAPGVQDWGSALAAAHHIMLSHGRAVPVIRANSPGAEVGVALDTRPVVPASDDPADVQATRHFDGFRNRWFFDPIFGRGYPADMVGAYHERGRVPSDGLPFVQPGDLAEISTPIDFLGLNYYTSLRTASGQEETEDNGVAPGPNPPPGFSEMGWESTPDALTAYLVRIYDEYRPPKIVITENGASYSDGPDSDGRIRDDRRIAYLREHIGAVAAAIEEGVPVAGYMEWSFLDNYEWAYGYSQRFGVVWVDFETLERKPKDSFYWYQRVIASNGAELG